MLPVSLDVMVHLDPVVTQVQQGPRVSAVELEPLVCLDAMVPMGGTDVTAILVRLEQLAEMVRAV